MMKLSPSHYLSPVYDQLYMKHPEVKAIESWKDVPDDHLKDDPGYIEAINKEAGVLTEILDYLDDPEGSYQVYYGYGEYLEMRGYTWQFYDWYLQVFYKHLESLKDIRPEVITALQKLKLYTSSVVKKALGKFKFNFLKHI